MKKALALTSQGLSISHLQVRNQHLFTETLDLIVAVDLLRMYLLNSSLGIAREMQRNEFLGKRNLEKLRVLDIPTQGFVHHIILTGEPWIQAQKSGQNSEGSGFHDLVKTPILTSIFFLSMAQPWIPDSPDFFYFENMAMAVESHFYVPRL